MLAAGAAIRLIKPGVFALEVDRTLGLTFAGGLIVGAGTQLGSGCTSGHGICGIGRFSLRSLVATCVFMATGAAAVFVLGHLVGGAT